jgi:hypothetical protein
MPSAVRGDLTIVSVIIVRIIGAGKANAVGTVVGTVRAGRVR